MANKHVHRKCGEPRVLPFSGPVADRQNPVAHGGVCLVETCRCGAERRTNSNAGALEVGPWLEAD